MFVTGELPNDVTMGDVKHIMSLADAMSDAGIAHGLAILSDGVSNHVCSNVDEEDPDDIEELKHAPQYDDSQVQVYLAYEQAIMAAFATMRAALRQQGYPLESEVPAAHT